MIDFDKITRTHKTHHGNELSILDGLFDGGGGDGGLDFDELVKLIELQAETNRLNQVTPFGGTQYIDAGQPLDQTGISAPVESLAQPTAPAQPAFTGSFQDFAESQGFFVPVLGQGTREIPTHLTAADVFQTQNLRDEYDQAISVPSSDVSSDPSIAPGTEVATQDTVMQFLSPELQALFDKQFGPNAFDSFRDEHFAEAKRLLDPVFAKQEESLRSALANRGQPIGGELANEELGLFNKRRADAFTGAAFQASNAAQNAQLNDFNRLITSMGGTALPVPQTNVAGLASLTQQPNGGNSLLNALVPLGAASIGAPPGTFTGPDGLFSLFG